MDEQLAPGRRRGDALVQAIYAATLAELADVGFGRLAMEGIAERARTGKMSLYRRWSTLQELVLDALINALEETPNPPDSGNLRKDLIADLKNTREIMNGPIGSVMSTIISERPRHPNLLAAIRSQVLEPRSSILQILERSAARGEISHEVITPQVCQAGRSIMIVRHLVQGSLPDDTEIAAIVDRVVLPALGAHRSTE
jgi:AcrR family transcriptional regulator